jgi:hypothetical protein
MTIKKVYPAPRMRRTCETLAVTEYNPFRGSNVIFAIIQNSM